MKRSIRKASKKKVKEEKLDLRQFALDMRASQIVTSLQVPPELCAMVFMPFMFIKDDKILERIKNAALLWGHMRDAGPRGVNGYPIFGAFGVLSKEEWEQVKIYLKELDEWQKKSARPTP